jgi:hypothetical protein
MALDFAALIENTGVVSGIPDLRLIGALLCHGGFWTFALICG